MQIEICVKAPPRSHATVTDANTDCKFHTFVKDFYFYQSLTLFSAFLGPFCQRVLLTLLEKKLPYRTHLIDLDNKPEW